MRPRYALSFALALALLLPLAPTAGAARGPIKGIDVSRFQGRIAWNKVGKTDLRFAYVQASRGSGRDCTVVPEECGRDQYFVRNYGNAKAAGLRVGAYHRAFAAGRTRGKAKQDARAEANRFIDVVGRVRSDDLRPALDVEVPFRRLDEGRLRLWIRTWANRVEKKLHVKPVLYTNSSSWLATGDTTSFARDGYPLWVANFDVRRPSVPADNWAGRGWTIWQYTSSGHVRGINGNVDRNRLKKGFGKLEAG
jgi:lysozyme